MTRKLLLLLLLGLLHTPTLAQKNSQATKVLAHIIHPDTFRADFIYTSGSPDEKNTVELSGQIVVQGKQYHLTLGEQIIIANGVTIWTYLPEAQEVHLSNHDTDQEALNPIQLLNSYRQGFLPVSMKSQEINNARCDVIELVAEDPDNWLTTMSLIIDQKTKYLVSITTWDQEHTWHKFLITTFEPNVQLDEDYFEFDPKHYGAVEVIDLR